MIAPNVEGRGCRELEATLVVPDGADSGRTMLRTQVGDGDGPERLAAEEADDGVGALVSRGRDEAEAPLEAPIRSVLRARVPTVATLPDRQTGARP